MGIDKTLFNAKNPILYGAFWTAHLSMLILNSFLTFAFLSLFDRQRKLEPGDGSNELPAGSPIFASEKKEKKKILKDITYVRAYTAACYPAPTGAR